MLAARVLGDMTVMLSAPNFNLLLNCKLDCAVPSIAYATVYSSTPPYLHNQLPSLGAKNLWHTKFVRLIIVKIKTEFKPKK